MKTVRRICLCIALLLFFCGCRAPEEVRYDIPADFIDLPFYTAESGNLLGTNNGDAIQRVYTLEGLPPEQYLCLVKGNEQVSCNYVWMHKDANDPIFQYDVKKIEIHQSTGQPVVLTEDPIINRLLAAVRTKTGVKIEHPSSLNLNTTVYLDLPCALVWSCGIETDETGGIRLFYRDAKTGDWYGHDVTAILADIEGLVLPSFEDGRMPE